ncbi:MAG: sugar phosphate nucleotidyltransferase [Acidimicrobiales bacterium]
MRAVVLVGGEGTRLRPLTWTTPKQLLPVVEVPMLERVVTLLGAQGIDEVVLSMGYRPDAFVEVYPDGAVGGVRVSYAVEPVPLDTAGAVGFAARGAAIDETFVVVNGDVLTDLDLGALVALHRARSALGTISLTAVDDPSRFGVVPTDDDGRVIAFVEKPPAGEEPTNLVNAGTYVLEAQVLDLIPEGRRVSIERETFPALVAGGRLYAHHDASYWLDTGTPDAYLQANRDLLAGRRGMPPAPGAVRAESDAGGIDDRCWTLGTPRLDGNVDGASLVADRATVALGAKVRGSVIGAGCVVGEGAEVEDSVLLPGAVVCAAARVTGSVLGHGATVGAGATIGPVSVLGDGAEVADGAQLRDARVERGTP